VIAVDTNILVYAFASTSERHARARDLIIELAEGSKSWAIPWHCIAEFLATVTNEKRGGSAEVLPEAIEFCNSISEAPGLVMLSEGIGFDSVFFDVVRDSNSVGGSVHDARIAALCRYHGVDELITADRDFQRFKGFRVRNPFE